MTVYKVLPAPLKLQPNGAIQIIIIIIYYFYTPGLLLLSLLCHSDILTT